MKKKAIISVLAITIATAGVFGAEQVFAQSGSGQNSPLVQKIADRFGLKQADVQAVFDQARSEKRLQMERNFQNTLDQAVKDGKLTDTQKQLILQKQSELDQSWQQNRENWSKLTVAERKSLREKEKQDLESWATQNNIDLNYFTGPGRHHDMM